MDDLIYLLLFLAWAAFAFYRNSQKKKQRAAQRTGSTRQQVDNEDLQEERSPGSLLEEILMGEQEERTIEEPYLESDIPESKSRIYSEAPVMEEEKGPVDFDDEYNLRGITSVEELDLETGKDESDKGEKAGQSIKVVTFDEDQNGPFDFDLRKAVIYSEILNPRYF
jgi:hypothetical protein